ncbi:MAG: hypothetical protein WCG23_02845 [bacterium]
MERLFVWIPVLWRDEDWDFEYLLEIVRFKLNRMSKNIDKYSYHLHKDRDVKKIKEVLSHIDHYKNIEKYAGDYVTEEETNLPIQDWLNRKLTSKQTYILKRNVELEKWHWQEIWRKISKNGQCWWS